MALEHTTRDQGKTGDSGRERTEAGAGEAPYLGLAPFEESDEQRFFGREDVTELIAFLAEQRPGLPLILVGASGAGKSSLLRAGLLPRLRAAAAAGGTGADRVEWYDLTVTGVAGFAARLAKAVRPGVPTMTGGWDMAGTAGAWGQAGNGAPAGEGALAALIVDHFEAVFTLADEAERNALLSALCELARDTLVVLALRADYYGRAIGHSRLLRALQERQVVLGPMSAVQLRRTVTEPALLAGAAVADDLADAALADMPADQPGALPLLSHALLAAWRRGDGRTLTLADYKAAGGMRDALGNSAEQAYQELTPAQRRLAGQLLPRLVHPAGDLPPIRVTVGLGELRRAAADAGAREADADAVLAAFAGQGLVIVDAGHARLTHDAVLSGWPRLRAWVEEDAAAKRARQAGRGQQASRDQKASRGQRASRAEKASRAERPAAGSGAGRETRSGRLRAVVAVLTVLVLAAAGLTAFAFEQQRAANQAEQAAAAGQQAANSRAAAFVAAGTSVTDPGAAGQLAAAAYAVAPTAAATSALLDSSAAASVARIDDTTGIVRSVSVSPSGRLLIAAGADGSLMLWNIASPGRPALIGPLVQAGAGQPLQAAAFSPDGTAIATAGAAGTIQLWQVSGTAAAPRVSAAGKPLTGPAGQVNSVAFSPDSRTLAAGSAGGTVRLWHVADPAHPAVDGKPLTLPGKGGGQVSAVAFGAGGGVLAAGTSAGGVMLWKVAGSAAPVRYAHMPLTGPGGAISEIAFSPEGNTLAASSADRKVWLWTMLAAAKHKPASAVADGTLAGASNGVNAVAFSPDGRSVAAGTSDASVLVWTLATRALTARVPQPGLVTSVSWDGTARVAAADANGTVALVSLPAPVLATGNSPGSVSYSPDGSSIAVGGTNIQLWAAAGRAPLATDPLASGLRATATAFSSTGLVAAALSNGTVALLNGRTLDLAAKPFPVIAGSGAAEAVAFSGDGKLLVTGAADGSVRLYDVSDAAHPVRLATADAPGGAVSAVAFAAGGTVVAAATAGGPVRVWRVSGGQSLTPAGTVSRTSAGEPAGLAFSPDGSMLAIGGSGPNVQLRSVADLAGHPVTLTGPTGSVRSAAFSPDGKTLAAGASDGSVWLWNITPAAGPVLIATLKAAAGDVTGVAFSPSGDQLAAADEGTVHVWDTSPAAALASVCGNLGQPLSRGEWNGYLPGVSYQAGCPGQAGS
jgi:WD40 repeat protein